MDPKSMTRKDFFALTFTLVGSAIIAPACSSSGGSGGGTGGTGGHGGTGGGAGGTGGGAGGTGGHTDAGGTGGTGGGAGGTGGHVDAASTDAENCTLPLPEEQIVSVSGVDGGPNDTNSHVHTVTVDGNTLSATTAQTITTSVFVNPSNDAGHSHDVTFTPSDLATLRGGGTVDIRSTVAANHTHTYRVSCHAISDAGGQ